MLACKHARKRRIASLHDHRVSYPLPELSLRGPELFAIPADHQRRSLPLLLHFLLLFTRVQTCTPPSKHTCSLWTPLHPKQPAKVFHIPLGEAPYAGAAFASRSRLRASKSPVFAIAAATMQPPNRPLFLICLIGENLLKRRTPVFLFKHSSELACRTGISGTIHRMAPKDVKETVGMWRFSPGYGPPAV